jgi:hypothetical protein
VKVVREAVDQHSGERSPQARHAGFLSQQHPQTSASSFAKWLPANDRGLTLKGSS